MSDKNFEEKLKKHWREEADSIPVPDSLHPAKKEPLLPIRSKPPRTDTSLSAIPVIQKFIA